MAAKQGPVQMLGNLWDDTIDFTDRYVCDTLNCAAGRLSNDEDKKVSFLSLNWQSLANQLESGTKYEGFRNEIVSHDGVHRVYRAAALATVAYGIRDGGMAKVRRMLADEGLLEDESACS